MEPLTDAVGLRTVGLRLRVLDVIDRQEQLVVVTLRPPAELGATISKDTDQVDSVFLEHRQYTIVEKIRCGDRRLGRVQLAGRDLGVGVHERLLVDAANAFNCADVVRVLRSQVSRVLGLDLTVNFVGGALAFQRDDLGLGQNNTFLGHFRFQGLEPELAALQLVAKPDAAHAAG